MDIELKNIALIEEGILELKGITLIADENDSGKSTIGKTLFTTLTTLNNFEREFLTNLSQRVIRVSFLLKELLDDKLKNEIKSTNEPLLEKITRIIKSLNNFNNEINHNFIKIEINDKFFKDLEKIFLELIEEADVLKQELENYIKKLNEENSLMFQNISFFVDTLTAFLALKVIFNYEKIKISSFQSTFNREFKNNIGNVFLKKEESYVKLDEKGEIIEINIENSNILKVNYGKIKEKNNAIYIESPLILDYIEEICQNFQNFISITDKNYRAKILKKALENEKKIDILDAVLGKEELYKDLLERIHKIILGEFEYNKSNKDFIYRKQGYTFDKKSVATGIKSFGIIEILLKNKQLDKNTILIIDEPEVHLHPKWQIKYAEILILISKELGVKILLNSHSPYLIRAMEVYRKTYDYEDNTKFYTLTDCTEGKSKKILDVTNNLNQIFDKLIEPYEILREVDERYSDDE
ncbi:ATP-binding protein [Fusobacterium nucleatum]|uniref:ATPase AAA-type core domain-containing protein n=1 Tax=Fusobacterium nucleatum subsp. polymorphum TaxID=76857 RepID=A0A2C6AVH4_FUSNP|nr:AAA family ATPase [Fusobacterium polymorphum]PHH95913.1 hypothetical protein CA840_00100 [Fusobacterium polymorphum]